MRLKIFIICLTTISVFSCSGSIPSDYVSDSFAYFDSSRSECIEQYLNKKEPNKKIIKTWWGRFAKVMEKCPKDKAVAKATEVWPARFKGMSPNKNQVYTVTYFYNQTAESAIKKIKGRIMENRKIEYSNLKQ